VPTLEIVHCGENFQALCSAVVGLFVLVDEANTDLKAKQLIYALLNHLDDALRFRDVYWVILDFVGQHVVSRHLNFDKKNAFDVSDKQAICLMDTYRLLLVMITRIPHHWIHLSQEELARLLFSTFHLLALTPTGSENAETKLIRPVNALALLDKSASWFKTWLLKVPNRNQLLSSLQESGLVSDVLQSLSRLSPARRLKSTNQAADIVELHTAQHS
uniref:BROMI middle region domain-containing protein n=1 Tax=Globisporangium ultimum (strain ATCC 200006 / CBS 805.95 / DAOM BR144) TaxID=431595 RepID=K3WEE2_GLOUD